MSNRQVLFGISLGISISVAFLLITGSPLLTKQTFSELRVPAGTWITWLGFIALPATILFGNRTLYKPESSSDRVFSALLKGLVVMGVLWVPVCYGLAGNLSFSFTEKEEFQGGQTAMRIFWYFNYTISALPLLILIVHWATSLIKKRQQHLSDK